jgi:hypothetical protein
VKDLTRITPGFAGYFAHWLEDQESLWRDEGERDKIVQLERFFAIFACAHGRLREVDIRDLLQFLEGARSPGRLDTYLRPIRRFLIGVDHPDGGTEMGIILSHPKFGIFLKEEYLDREGVEDAQLAFIAWGSSVLLELSQGLRSTSEVPQYLLQYFGQHLREGNAPSGLYLQLVTEGWLRAWERFEGGFRGFSRDVGSALEALACTFDKDEGHLVQILRCRLVQCSIQSIGAALPNNALVFGFKHKALSFKQLKHWLDFKPPSDRVQILARIAPHVDAGDFPDVFAAAELVALPLKVRLLSSLIPFVQDTERENLVLSLLDLFHELAPFDQCSIVEAIVPYVPARNIPELVRAVHQLPDSYDAQSARIALIPLLTPKERAAAVDDALGAARRMRQNHQRVGLLRQLLPLVSGESFKAMTAAVLQLSRDTDRVQLLSELLHKAPLAQRGKILSVLTHTTRKGVSAYERALAEIALLKAGSFGSSSAGSAIQAVLLNQERYAFLDMLEGLAPFLTEGMREELITCVVKS